MAPWPVSWGAPSPGHQRLHPCGPTGPDRRPNRWTGRRTGGPPHRGCPRLATAPAPAVGSGFRGSRTTRRAGQATTVAGRPLGEGPPGPPRRVAQARASPTRPSRGPSSSGARVHLHSRTRLSDRKAIIGHDAASGAAAGRGDDDERAALDLGRGGLRRGLPDRVRPRCDAVGTPDADGLRSGGCPPAWGRRGVGGVLGTRRRDGGRGGGPRRHLALRSRGASRRVGLRGGELRPSRFLAGWVARRRRSPGRPRSRRIRYIVETGQ